LGGNQWRSGPRSLMESMGLAYRETRLNAGLAWLLQPDGHHGLGDALLLPLLSAVGLGEVDASNVRIVTEQSRDAGATRADLVLYGGGVVAELLAGGATSSSSGARSFLAWVRALVLERSAWTGAGGAYARLVSGQRWQSRRAVLVAARFDHRPGAAAGRPPAPGP